MKIPLPNIPSSFRLMSSVSYLTAKDESCGGLDVAFSAIVPSVKRDLIRFTKLSHADWIFSAELLQDFVLCHAVPRNELQYALRGLQHSGAQIATGVNRQ